MNGTDRALTGCAWTMVGGLVSVGVIVAVIAVVWLVRGLWWALTATF